MLRYIRQIALQEVGIAGQKKLLDSKVLIVGAGGLGSPAALYLAGAGIGTIGIIDDDVVNLDNLHRQVIHRAASIGKPKTESAQKAISEINPEVSVRAYKERLCDSNAASIIKEYDIVLDGSDNFETRYLANSICVKAGIPFILGSILRFEGQIAIFCHPRKNVDPVRSGDPHLRGDDSIPCYSCVYPEPPPSEVSPTCARAGVLGMMPGIIGTMQALEAVKLIAGFGEPLIGKLLIFDGLACKMRTLEVKKDPKCKVCSSPL